ncbi:MAG: hypothetical protein JSV51_07485 [Candidatus Bathyarchaeota archaeon]|nr:MAG: hypothetical protein JSV51_07485 [Candidatus Bathyarchaeota archaeon]
MVWTKLITALLPEVCLEGLDESVRANMRPAERFVFSNPTHLLKAFESGDNHEKGKKDLTSSETGKGRI